ncbi:Glycolipid 2-alpha-mannosyltransferase 1 [Brettanomyces nanus]|uniref:Glycolipid 2-alpha-mannosyltransferase 1 n=1 Tax=Eeniella nana TaxID=13502 RepID=A0A875S7R8_EENNA|nr:Glycolipid 2-alpha-mannosyltransferase 1 [Brettanomyces nanus]QPG77396.1 Glycolipid 2-alpha-mannosyltransferase 1 [Brettanomyces nanus]
MQVENNDVGKAPEVTEGSDDTGEKEAFAEQGDKVKATFVSLARNRDLYELVESIRQVEDKFNKKYHYDWVFLNDDEFDTEFKKVTTAMVSGTTYYGTIPKEQWGFPEWIDTDKAAKVREEMRAKKIIYGDSISYRHMCRYESGFFFRHPLMQQYEYYWRVEPGIKIFCNIDYDVFKLFKDKNYAYGFTISLPEYRETIPTLWETTKKFMAEYPQYVDKNNMQDFISDDGGSSYNGCHFWSNFEIGDLKFWRSDAYMKYFEYLDKAGGFFYERWGDAPVHSIAASLLLPKERIHFFDDVGYYHVPFFNCPVDEKVRLENQCSCNPNDDFTFKGYSCVNRYYKVNNLKKPDGWEKYAN